jgi:succinate dehydrogenase / fumarate reductase, cytochrome b subunit
MAAEAQLKTPASANRPLSPHLQVYRPQLTSVMSIIHRGTGVALCAGAVLIAIGLLALADGYESWTYFRAFCASIYGKLIMGGFMLALSYHWLNGLRHLGWDVGYGLDIKATYVTGKLVLVLFVLISTALIYFGLRSGT